jgi:hypothetical protein
MRSIRGGMGLGDALYVQAIARYLTRDGERLRVHSAWPDVFRPLGERVEVAPFTRQGINVLAHYSARKGNQGTSQFRDCCLTAGVNEEIELRLDWGCADTPTTRHILSFGRPVVLVQLPRSPMGRTDGFGKELLPNQAAIQRAIDRIKGRALLVQVGSGDPLYRLGGIDIDLTGRTTVSELIDLASVCDGMLGYVSFILPLAESLGKKGLLVWSRAGRKAGHVYVRQITPEKVVHRKDLITSVWDGKEDDIEGAADDFLR